jgi:glycine cleavage system H protein
MVPGELRYTAEHEWIREEDGVLVVGITDYAQDQLGDVVFVSAPAAGTAVKAGSPCGEVESTKSVSDLYAPVDGEVTAQAGSCAFALRVTRTARLMRTPTPP